MERRLNCLKKKRKSTNSNTHIEMPTSIPKIVLTSEVKRLRNLYDMVESHVRGLESMEISSDMYSCFLNPLLWKNCPKNI